MSMLLWRGTRLRTSINHMSTVSCLGTKYVVLTDNPKCDAFSVM